ncbi:E3 ubiquitin-protein ligase RNF183 [Etheostoma cragini]|uniref:E3 ubiquitin-protein ligase RNF183 n=1 Tax=Etheostoma cragini TaxID=417921 RepID=UPI00155E14FB|nr:E3 ubiquitin-protein ligase RNF183 [Etheostoma cragini]
MNDDEERHSHGARQAPNVKPKLNQKEQNSKEDMWKKVRPAQVRRSRSTDSERGERGRRRERDNRHQAHGSKRGRSEETRSNRRKVKPSEDDVEDTECAVCFCKYNNIFKTPKLLVCGHTFCLECLARINVTTPEVKTLCCPICRALTELPHGQDLPRLGNNEDIISKLPSHMQRALSIRFKRSKGKLLLKNPPPRSQIKSNILSLPKKSHNDQVTASGDLHVDAMEQGTVTTSVVNVGRPPNRVRGRLRRLFRSNQCYYVVVGSIIAITVALMLVGILGFVIKPIVRPAGRPVSQSTGSPGTRP